MEIMHWECSSCKGALPSGELANSPGVKLKAFQPETLVEKPRRALGLPAFFQTVASSLAPGAEIMLAKMVLLKSRKSTYPSCRSIRANHRVQRRCT